MGWHAEENTWLPFLNLGEICSETETTDFSLSLNPKFTPIQYLWSTILAKELVCAFALTIEIHCNVFINILFTANYIEQCNPFQTSRIQLWCKFGIERVHSSVLTALSCLSAQCYSATTMMYTTEYTNVKVQDLKLQNVNFYQVNDSAADHLVKLGQNRLLDKSILHSVEINSL